MIKNLLYSLFLHFLLLLAIYSGFNLKNFNEENSSQIAVSLIALNGSGTTQKIIPNSGDSAEIKNNDAVEEKKSVAEKPKSPRKYNKNKVKKTPKKLTKSKSEQVVAKSVKEEKIQEFKQQKLEEKKQEEANKIKENKAVKENQDEEENNLHKKENDFGAKEKSDDEKEISEEKNQAQSDALNSAENIENLDLSAREKFNIQTQLKMCYKKAIEETKLTSKTRVMVKVNINKDGYIESNLDELVNMEYYNNPKDTRYKIAVDNVRRAIDLCSPLRNLPLDKYEIWHEAVLEFDENDVK